MQEQYTEAQYDRAAAESTVLKLAVSNFLSSWTDLENALSELFNEILGFDSEKTKIAFAAFYSPTSTETQLAMIVNCLNLLVEERGYDLEIIKVWAAINKRLADCKQDRNFIAHSSIHYLEHGADILVRLTSPTTNISRWTRAPHNDKPLPGYGERELSDKTIKIENAIEMVKEFETFMVALTSNVGSSQEKLVKLKARHLKASTQAPSVQAPLK